MAEWLKAADLKSAVRKHRGFESLLLRSLNRFGWRGGRAAEGAGLLNQYTGNCITGSNPVLSANPIANAIDEADLGRGGSGSASCVLLGSAPRPTSTSRCANDTIAVMAEVHDIVPELLRSIRDEMRGMRADIGELRQETRAGLSELRVSLAVTNERLDKLVENTGTHWRDLEVRVRKLEQAAGAKR